MKKLILLASLFIAGCNPSWADGVIPLKGNGNGTGRPPGGDPTIGDTPIRRTPLMLPEVSASLYDGVLTINLTNLSFSSATVMIQDENGEIVLTESFDNPSVEYISVHSLLSGVYSILLETDTYTFEGEFEIE